MLYQIRFLFRFAGSTRSSLRRLYGRTWPWALLRCAWRGRRLVQATQWADRKDAEAQHVRALATLPALYLDLRARVGPAARDAMREMAAAFVDAEQTRIASDAGLFQIAEPRERWHAFFDRAVSKGMGAFNESECLSVEAGRFHLRVVRCLLAELAGEAGVQDLAPMVCEAELAFSRRLLPQYDLTRGVSDRSTIAHGHACCEYIWKAPAAAPVEEAADESESPAPPVESAAAAAAPQDSATTAEDASSR